MDIVCLLFACMFTRLYMFVCWSVRLSFFSELMRPPDYVFNDISTVNFLLRDFPHPFSHRVIIRPGTFSAQLRYFERGYPVRASSFARMAARRRPVSSIDQLVIQFIRPIKYPQEYSARTLDTIGSLFTWTTSLSSFSGRRLKNQVSYVTLPFIFST